MTTSNQPRILTAEECLVAFKKHMPEIISPIAKGRMWKASIVLHKYLESEDVPFGLFHAFSEEELNLQAQWKIASCYEAVESGEMAPEDGFMWIETIEWGAYTEPYRPDADDEEHFDNPDIVLDASEIIWPYILIFLDVWDSDDE